MDEVAQRQWSESAKINDNSFDHMQGFLNTMIVFC
jgi:hypothetical protein